MVSFESWLFACNMQVFDILFVRFLIWFYGIEISINLLFPFFSLSHDQKKGWKWQLIFTYWIWKILIENKKWFVFEWFVCSERFMWLRVFICRAEVIEKFFLTINKKRIKSKLFQSEDFTIVHLGKYYFDVQWTIDFIGKL